MSNEKFQGKYRIATTRVRCHNYNGGVYFITICTKKMKCYLGEISNAIMHLSSIGKYVDECIKNIEILHDDISVPIYVIMPNHIHLIIMADPPIVETSYYGVSTKTHDGVSTKNGEFVSSVETPHCDVSTRNDNLNKNMQRVALQCGRISHVIGRFKTAVTRYAHQNHIEFAWQPRFYDRIIRSYDELNRISDYITHNVANWEKDELF